MLIAHSQAEECAFNVSNYIGDMTLNLILQILKMK